MAQQTIFGRIFRTVAEVKAAVADFVARYNASWPLERLGYRSPRDYRVRYEAQQRAAA